MMTPITLHKHPYWAFLGLALLLFVLILTATGVLLQSWDHLKFFRKLVTANPQHPVAELVFAALYLVPFLLLGLMCASLARRKGSKSGLGLLALGAVLLGFVYIDGFHGSQTAMAQHAWTAATFSIGLIPFFSLPALFICVGVRWFLLRSSDAARP